MRFEREVAEEEPERVERGNRWYFFIPLALLAFWMMVGFARLAVFAFVEGGRWTAVPRSAEGLHQLLGVIDWFGGLGVVLLFPFYLLVLAKKQAPGWLALGALCCWATLPLYIVLLFLPARRASAAATPELPPFGSPVLSRPQSALLKNSFVCDSCDALLNYGVSECPECGQRYRYVDGVPWTLDD